MRRFIYALLLAVAPVLAVAEDRILTTSGLPIWDSALLLYLVETQPLADHGIAFEFKPWRAPEELGAALARQDIHIASAPAMLAPIFTAKGLQLDLLGTSAPTNNIKIVARQGTGEIAVPFKGGMPDLILQTLGTATELTPRYTGTATEAMQLLLTGQVSAAFLAEPLATIAGFQAGTDLQTTDACALWKVTHAIEHCPATGVYLGAGLNEADVVLIADALKNAHADLALDPALAATLLQEQFPALAQAPLVPAFTKITPNFQPMCETSWLTQTLLALEPIAPFAFSHDRLVSAQC